MGDHLQRLYAAAARAGLLKDCTWRPADGRPAEIHPVGFAAPDTLRLDGLTASTDYEMTYPQALFEGLAVREVVEIAGTSFQVREVRAIGDGTELRASLTRL
jgi:hypothetical protein